MGPSIRDTLIVCAKQFVGVQAHCLCCCRDYSAADVLTTANALQKSQLQTLSVACGRVRIPKAYANVTLSVTGYDGNSTECQQAAQLADDGNAITHLVIAHAHVLCAQ